MPMADEDLISEMRRLRLAVEALQADFKAAGIGAPPPLADRLLEAVYAVLACETFDANTLMEICATPLSTRQGLREIVIQITRSISSPGAGRRLGRFLAQHRDHVAGDLRLVAVGAGRSGRQWRVASFADITRGRQHWPSFRGRGHETDKTRDGDVLDRQDDRDDGNAGKTRRI